METLLLVRPTLDMEPMVRDHARSLGLSRVMLSCCSDNEGSRKTILKWGGKKERELPYQGGKTVEVYWIEL